MEKEIKQVHKVKVRGEISDCQIDTVACPYCKNEPSYLPEVIINECFDYTQPDTLDHEEFNIILSLTPDQCQKAEIGCPTLAVRSIDFEFIDYDPSPVDITVSWCPEDVIHKGAEKGRVITEYEAAKLLSDYEKKIKEQMMGQGWVSIECAIDMESFDSDSFE